MPEAREADLDEALEDTFPASDPPAFMAGLSVPGSPCRLARKEKAGTTDVPPGRKAADASGE